MPNYKPGNRYEIESGVTLNVFWMPKGRFQDKKMGALAIANKVSHLFTKEVLGEFLPRYDGPGVQRTEWFVGKGPNGGGGITPVAGLPEVIRSRYALDGLDFVCVRDS